MDVVILPGRPTDGRRRIPPGGSELRGRAGGREGAGAGTGRGDPIPAAAAAAEGGTQRPGGERPRRRPQPPTAPPPPPQKKKMAAARASVSRASAARAAVAAPAAVGSAKAIVTWDPKRAMAYECMSFLPDLTDAQIAKQVDYMIGNGWTPCVEFEDRDKAIAKIDTILGPGYYHNRYWNMWKLPLFGCTDGTQVISEIKECLQTYPDVTVRVIAFDRQRQVQVAGFIVQK